MAEIKTLANCSLKEFLKQANRIRKEVADFFELAKIGEIRKRHPEYTGKETEEEKVALIRKQGKKNLSDIIDFCLEENADATIRVIGLMCFKTPEEVEQMEVSEFLDAAFDLFSNERVMSFFSKLAHLELTSTEKP